MASGGGYSALKVVVTADTRGLSMSIRQAATDAGDDAAKSVGGSMSKGLKALAPIGGAIFKSVATGLGIATTAAVGFGISAFKSAARVGEMNATLRALAAANNLSYPAMLKQVAAIRGQGVEAGVAQQVVAQFARNQLDLAKSTDLARVAQDAAVISGQNSSDTLGQLIHGITTQNSLVLRNAGVNVQAGQAVANYAKEVGKSVAELTAAERSQAVLNEVIAAGKPIAGAYAAAMNEPGKVLRSFPRIIDDIKIAIGAGLVKAFGPAIIGGYDLAKAFAAAVEPGGKLSPIFDAIGVAAAKMAAPISSAVKAATTFLETLSPSKVNAITSAVSKFGPAIAAVGAASAIFTGSNLLGSIPIIGPMLKSLLAPLGLIAKAFLSVGQAAIALIPGLGGIAPAAGTLGAALGPVGLIIAGVVAAIAVLMAISPEFRAAVMDVAGAVLSALKPAFTQIIAAAKPLIAIVFEVARAIAANMAPAIRELAPIIGPLGSVLGSLLSVVAGLAKVLALVVIPAIRLYAAFNKLLIIHGLVPILRMIAAVLNVVAGAIALVVRWILGGSPGLIPAFTALLGVATSVMGALKGVVLGGFKAIASAISAAWSTITGTTKAAWSAIRSVISSGISAARSVVSSGAAAMLGVMRSLASGFVSSASSAARGFASALSSGLSGARSIVTSAVSAMIGAARSLVGGFASAGANAASAMAGAIRGGLASVVGTIRSTISSAVSAAKGALKIKSPSRVMMTIGRQFIAGFVQAIAGSHLAQAVAGIFGQVPGAVSGALGGLDLGGHTAAGEGGQSGGGLGAGLRTRLPDLISPLAGLAEQAGALRPGRAVTVNVYPQPGQSEVEIAAAVSRRLGWATATGRA